MFNASILFETPPKRELTWLQNDPHFWLQYGMAQLTHKEYTVAQTYLDQAYALASRKNYAHTDHIDSQQARLYLLQAIDSNDSSDGIFQLFKKAHQLINKLENDIHNVVPLIKPLNSVL